MIFLEPLLPGKKTVEAGAATRLIVVFLGSDAKGVTATGIAVAYSMLPCGSVMVSSFPVFISSKMLVIESFAKGLASWITTFPARMKGCVCQRIDKWH